MKNSFVQGAAILMAANAVSKILGAVLKIPLTYIIHEEGMAVYNTAFSVYAMLLSFVVSGIPFAISKLTAVEIARNNKGGAKAIVNTSSLMLLGIGCIGTLIMWFGADFLAVAMKEERAATAIRAVAPAVMLVALGEGAKSGFQGEGNMLPTAISQCIEAFIKLGAGFMFAVCLIQYGSDKSAAGAISGVTAGELAAACMLVGTYYFTHRKIKSERGKNGEYTKVIAQTAMPVILMAITTSAISVIDTSLIRTGLLRAGLTSGEARYLYGAYSGYAMTVLNLPAGLLATLGVSIIPAISGAVAIGNSERVKKLTRNGVGICCICGLLASASVAVFGDLMLKIASPSIFFICMMQLSGSVLQAMGYTGRVFVSSLVVGIIKLLSAIFLISIPEINIYGAAIGSDVAFMTGMIMNFIFLSRTSIKREMMFF